MEDTKTGKISDEDFKSQIFPYCGAARAEVRVGPSFGTDISIIDLPNGYEMALTSDPLSYIPNLGLEESAWLSVHLMANDMATTGIAPQYAQFVLNLPSYVSAHDFEVYWQYIHSFCQQIGVAITGGHTSRFQGLDSTIAGGGTMISTAPKGQMLCSQWAQPGQDIVVTKQAALVATSILARSFPNTVKNLSGNEVYQEACALFYQTSSLSEALIAAHFNHHTPKSITAMHDVTEGGILGAIYEMAVASGCGALVEAERLPLGNIPQSVCGVFNIDPAYSVGAGSMIMAVAPNSTAALLKTLEENHIAATCVGRFTAPSEGVHLLSAQGSQNIIPPDTDPYWAAFFNALKQGLT